MSENDKSPEAENHSAETHTEPGPDSLFKLFIQLIRKLPPVVRWGVLIVTLVGWFLMGGIWDRIPAAKQEKLIEWIFSSSKPKSPVPVSAPQVPEPKKDPLLAKEIKDRGLLVKIRKAESYLKGGGSPSNKESAFKIYQDILAQLSPEATRELDQDLLAQAKSDDRRGHIDDALLKYKALFEKALNEN